MGWKSTREISRDEVIKLISWSLNSLSNEQLGNTLEGIYGDDPNLPYYGHNFMVVDEIEEE